MYPIGNDSNPPVSIKFAMTYCMGRGDIKVSLLCGRYYSTKSRLIKYEGSLTRDTKFIY